MLARRLKGADRVIFTYPPEGVSITVTGEEVKRVVQAISIAKKRESFYLCESGLAATLTWKATLR